jgi:hypothetical protein
VSGVRGPSTAQILAHLERTDAGRELIRESRKHGLRDEAIAARAITGHEPGDLAEIAEYRSIPVARRSVETADYAGRLETRAGRPSDLAETDCPRCDGGTRYYGFCANPACEGFDQRGLYWREKVAGVSGRNVQRAKNMLAVEQYRRLRTQAATSGLWDDPEEWVAYCDQLRKSLGLES